MKEIIVFLIRSGCMNKKQLIVAWMMIVLLAVVSSGCALIGTAVSAGIAYGLYQATKK